MTNENPYLAPAADPDPVYDVASEARIWREGRLLVVERGARLPLRCIRCNSDQHVHFVRKKLIYKPFWPFQRVHRVKLDIGYCRRCRRQRLTGSLVPFLLVLLGLAAFLPNALNPGAMRGGPYLLGWFLITAGLVVKYWLQSPTVRRIDDLEIRLSGICTAYLEQLPSCT